MRLHCRQIYYIIASILCFKLSLIKTYFAFIETKLQLYVKKSNFLHYLVTLSFVKFVNVIKTLFFLFFLATGVIYLSPWCFQSPMEQLKLLETGSTVNVQSYMAYLKDVTGLLANPGLHPSVKSDVATLAPVLEHFKKQHTESPLNKFIIRR